MPINRKQYSHTTILHSKSTKWWNYINNSFNSCLNMSYVYVLIEFINNTISLNAWVLLFLQYAVFIAVIGLFICWWIQLLILNLLMVFIMISFLFGLSEMILFSDINLKNICYKSVDIVQSKWSFIKASIGSMLLGESEHATESDPERCWKPDFLFEWYIFQLYFKGLILTVNPK